MLCTPPPALVLLSLVLVLLLLLLLTTTTAPTTANANATATTTPSPTPAATNITALIRALIHLYHNDISISDYCWSISPSWGSKIKQRPVYGNRSYNGHYRVIEIKDKNPAHRKEPEIIPEIN